MGTKEIADDIAAMAKAGDLAGIGHKYWAEDVVSIEHMDGPMAHIQGKAAVQGKSDWWNGAHEVHSLETHGPYVNGDAFALRFVMDVTAKESGQRMTMDEVALYTLRDGKIAEERFFY